jgi:hypothetical protein
METTEARRLIAMAERGVVALERIATALEQANAADPLQMIQDALTAEQPVNLDGDLTAIKLGPHPELDPDADMPPHIRRAIDKQRQS